MYNEFITELNELCRKYGVKIVNHEIGMAHGLEVTGEDGTVGIMWARQNTIYPGLQAPEQDGFITTYSFNRTGNINL